MLVLHATDLGGTGAIVSFAGIDGLLDKVLRLEHPVVMRLIEPLRDLAILIILLLNINSLQGVLECIVL